MKKIQKFLANFIDRYEPLMVSAVIVTFIILVVVQAIAGLVRGEMGTFTASLLLGVLILSAINTGNPQKK